MSQANRHYDLLHIIRENKKTPPPSRELIEAYLKKVITYDESESGQPAIQHEAETTDGSDQLTAFQVRGFRRDILKYQDEQLLFDTGIEKSLGLLHNYKNVQVREAAISLEKQWVFQYPDTERDASFYHIPTDTASIHEELSHQISLVRDMGRAIMAMQTHPPRSSYAGESSKCSSQGNCSENYRANAESFIKNSGHMFTGTLASVEGEASTALSESDYMSCTGLPNTDFRALALGKLHSRPPPITSVRSKEDFVSFVKSVTGLDNRTTELLRYDLGVSYDDIATHLNSACWTLAAKHTIRACSMIIQEAFSKKITALARLEEQDDQHETVSPASTRKTLLQEKANLERMLGKQKAELKEASDMHQEDLTDTLISAVIPLKFVIEEICGVREISRSLFGSDPKAGLRTIKDLETETKSLSSELVATKMQLAKAHSDNNALRAQLDGSRQAHAELKNGIASERSSMNNKFYKDIEARVEDRVRQDKARLAEAEAKSHQYDTIKTDYARLQDKLREATREIGRFKMAKVDFDVRFADLKREKIATQQGYEQVCERSDLLEAQLRALEAEMEESQASLRASGSSVAVPSKEEATEKSQSTRSTIEIVTYNQQLNEAERLEMIACRWRNDLKSAVDEQEKFKESLEDTETRIAVAITQLEEMQGPSTSGV
ncbi:hypothetical protein B5807_10554 [Epicoccum nigrum]|uniref:Uncharacterized protein n=1 Tax=Epicoccum nigrum TaxID=105696 RepID=A0A1Y2LNA3_EPING|nr:hypothetical protein B5807_10554 [Epicoccum nigrum]